MNNARQYISFEDGEEIRAILSAYGVLGEDIKVEILCNFLLKSNTVFWVDPKKLSKKDRKRLKELGCRENLHWGCLNHDAIYIEEKKK